MPHSSRIGRPSAAQNSSTARALGAAPVAERRTWSRPSICRSGANTAASAAAYPAGGGAPRRVEPAHLPQRSEHGRVGRGVLGEELLVGPGALTEAGGLLGPHL